MILLLSFLKILKVLSGNFFEPVEEPYIYFSASKVGLYPKKYSKFT